LKLFRALLSFFAFEWLSREFPLLAILLWIAMIPVMGFLIVLWIVAKVVEITLRRLS